MLTIGKAKRLLREIHKYELELLWAKRWDDTKRGLEWIEGMPGFSPGGAAVGYNYVYAMTRILNELKPSSVLDIGLGMSSTLISAYFKYYNPEGGYHTIVEHDKDWMAFYQRNNELSNQSRIVRCECVRKQYRGSEYNAYKDFEAAVGGKKYAVISIDAPIGWDEKYKHSRRDVLDILPDALEDSFVLVMDDCNRRGEAATIAEIESLFKANKIPYSKGYYLGQTDCCVLASLDNKFFCTM